MPSYSSLLWRLNDLMYTKHSAWPTANPQFVLQGCGGGGMMTFLRPTGGLENWQGLQVSNPSGEADNNVSYTGNVEFLRMTGRHNSFRWIPGSLANGCSHITSCYIMHTSGDSFSLSQWCKQINNKQRIKNKLEIPLLWSTTWPPVLRSPPMPDPHVDIYFIYWKNQNVEICLLFKLSHLLNWLIVCSGFSNGEVLLPKEWHVTTSKDVLVVTTGGLWATRIYFAEARVAAKHPGMQGTDDMTKNYLSKMPVLLRLNNLALEKELDALKSKNPLKVYTNLCVYRFQKEPELLWNSPRARTAQEPALLWVNGSQAC